MKIANKDLKAMAKEFASYPTNGTKSLCERFFSKAKNKNFLASISVLDFMIKQTREIKPSLSKSDIKEIDDKIFIDKTKPNYKDTLITDALKILRCNKLILLEESGYSINEDLWYRRVRYKIKDYTVLKSLAPALVAYVKNDIEYMPNDFFKMLDPMSDFVLMPTSFHNSDFGLEKYVYESVRKGAKIQIRSDNGRDHVYPIGIVFDGDRKKLEFQTDNDDKKVFRTDLSNIVYKEPDPFTVEKEAVSTIQPLNQMMSVPKFEVRLPIKAKKMDVVLAVGEMAYEAFNNVNILDNMRLITDEREKYYYISENKIKLDKMFVSSKDKEPWSDFFLVFASDHKERIVDVILKNLNHVKVLEPSSGILQKEITDRMKIYMKNENLQIDTDDIS